MIHRHLARPIPRDHDSPDVALETLTKYIIHGAGMILIQPASLRLASGSPPCMRPDRTNLGGCQQTHEPTS